MPSLRRITRLLGPLAVAIAAAVWAYRLATGKRFAAATVAEPASAYMSLTELLGHFRSEDIARCLRDLGLPSSGNKRERMDRFIDMAALPEREEGWSVSRTISLFTEADLRRVCRSLDIDDADKSSMARLLAERVDSLR